MSIKLCYIKCVTDGTELLHKTPFEEELFKDGYYVFQPNGEIFEAEVHYKDVMNNFGQNRIERSSVELSQLAEILADIELQHLNWKQKFSGKIPKRWGSDNGENMVEDMKRAGQEQVQLDDVLIDAGVCHFNRDVALQTGINQKLNPNQLAIIFVRAGYYVNPLLSADQRDAIIEHQIKMGLIDTDRYKASGIAYAALELTKARQRSQKSNKKIPG